MNRDDKLMPRLRRFFEDNPDEFLSYADIAVKFGCSVKQASTACMHLREQGLLTTTVVAMLNPDRKR